MVTRVAAVIRVDAIWLAIEPLDTRAGTETALALVVAVFGTARPHHAYCCVNRRANRLKVLVHDGSACGWPRAGSTAASSRGLRPSTARDSAIGELLPHRWKPASNT